MRRISKTQYGITVKSQYYQQLKRGPNNLKVVDEIS